MIIIHFFLLVFFSSGIRADKPDSDLFFVDKENLESETKQQGFKSEKEKSLKIKLHNLRCYRNLLPDPNNSIPAHILNPLQAKIPDSKRTEKREKLDVNKAKRKLKRITKSTKGIVKGAKKIVEAANQLFDFNRDLWGSSEKPVINVVNEYYLRSTKKHPINVGNFFYFFSKGSPLTI